ncbi:acyltransferase [Limibacter armeniacum]|uniref:acyltransferase family protein n=1 Tax=Limibacter armeniacum TaxID=466084 RepID=UPI002FE5040A
MKTKSNLSGAFIYNERVFGLDFLRALAIILVVLKHGMGLLGNKLYHIQNAILFEGVAIFFVLSGFLIGGLLIRMFVQGKVSIGDIFLFWRRRWFRTLPNYFLILFILIGLEKWKNPNFSVLVHKRYFLFAQNLWQEHPTFFAEAWSLCVEEWFYFLIPLSMLVMRLIKLPLQRTILLTILIFIVVPLVFRYERYLVVDVKNITDWDLIFRKQVFTRLDGITFGVLGAYFQYYHKNLWDRYKKQLLLVSMILFTLLKANELTVQTYGVFKCVFYFTIYALATLCLLPFLSNWKSNTSILGKWITNISLISYSMYVLNLSIVMGYILPLIDLPILFRGTWLGLLLNYTLYWGMTIGLSTLLYRYFESPITNLRDVERSGSWLRKF